MYPEETYLPLKLESNEIKLGLLNFQFQGEKPLIPSGFSSRLKLLHQPTPGICWVEEGQVVEGAVRKGEGRDRKTINLF